MASFFRNRTRKRLAARREAVQEDEEVPTKLWTANHDVPYQTRGDRVHVLNDDLSCWCEPFHQGTVIHHRSRP